MNNKDNAMYMKLQCNGFINVNKIKTNDNGNILLIVVNTFPAELFFVAITE